MLLWPWNQQETFHNHWIMLSKMRFSRRHQQEYLCGVAQTMERQSGHEEMIRSCKGSGEEHNSKCPWLRQGKDVLKNWTRAGSLNAQVRLPPLSAPAWGPGSQLEAELRAPSSAVLQGDPGEVCWGAVAVPPSPSLSLQDSEQHKRRHRCF